MKGENVGMKQNQSNHGNDLSVFPKRNAVDQKTGIFEFMRIIDLCNAGFGHNMQAAVRDDLRCMPAKRIVDIDAKKTGVGLVDIDDLTVRIADDYTNFHVLYQVLEKPCSFDWIGIGGIGNG